MHFDHSQLKTRVQRLLALQAILVSLGIVAPVSSTRAQTTVTVKVVVPEQDVNGSPYDGVRIFALPIEIGTVNPPDLAVCVTTLGAATECYKGDNELLRSKCPDSFQCAYEITVDLENPFVFSIFDLDPVIEDTELQSIMNERKAGRKFPAFIEKRIDEIVKKQWTWIESVVIYPNTDPDENNELEDVARTYIREVSRGGLLKRKEFDRLSGPFPRIAYEDCLVDGICPLRHGSIEFLAQ